MTMKPILFNTEMVRAILEGRKTVTRRVIKPQPLSKLAFRCMGHKCGKWAYPSRDAHEHWDDSSYRIPKEMPYEEYQRVWTPPCNTGDILYVRETWSWLTCGRRCNWPEHFECNMSPSQRGGCFVYKATHETGEDIKWNPSIHMPKDAARIFLLVLSVRVERLQDITINGLQDEGIIPQGYISQYASMGSQSYFDKFKGLWDSTIKPADQDKYGWAASPWVWVIEFERCEKPEEENK